MSDNVRYPDFHARRERDEMLKWQKLLHEMAQEPPLHNADITTSKRIAPKSDWKKFDNIGTLRRLLDSQKERRKP